MFYPGTGSEKFFISDTDPNFFHPGSRFLNKKSGSKLKIPFSCCLRFPVASLGSPKRYVIFTVEKSILKKMKDSLTNKYAGIKDPGFGKRSIPDLGSGDKKHRIPDLGSWMRIRNTARDIWKIQ
jgi:hypothetical protein